VLLFCFATLCKARGFKANNHSIASRSIVILFIEQKEIKLKMLFTLSVLVESSCVKTLQFLSFLPGIVDTVKYREVGKNG
jgi:hypothetical protein